MLLHSTVFSVEIIKPKVNKIQSNFFYSMQLLLSGFVSQGEGNLWGVVERGRGFERRRDYIIGRGCSTG